MLGIQAPHCPVTQRKETETMGSNVYEVDDYEIDLHRQNDTLTIRTRKVPEIYLGAEDSLDVMVSRIPRPSSVPSDWLDMSSHELLPCLRKYVDDIRETLVERERAAVFGLEQFLRAGGRVHFDQDHDYEPFPFSSGDRVLLLEGPRCISVRFGDDEIDLITTPVIVTNYWMNLMPDERWAVLAIDDRGSPPPRTRLFPVALERFAKVPLGALVLVPVAGHKTGAT